MRSTVIARSVVFVLSAALIVDGIRGLRSKDGAYISGRFTQVYLNKPDARVVAVIVLVLGILGALTALFVHFD